MLEQAISDHDPALSLPGPIIFDRGLPDLLAYAGDWQLDTRSILQALESQPALRNVFWFPAWQAIYTRDDEPRFDFAGTLAFGVPMTAWYTS